MKVKKIILAMVSTLIILAIAFSQSAYASTPLPDASATNPLKLVSLKVDNYTKTGEFQYSIGNPTDSNSIIINRIGQTNGTGVSRIYDAYCARADKGFETRPTTVYQTGDSAKVDTYNAKINMVTGKSQIDTSILETMNTSVGEGVTAYDAMLQLTNLLYLEEDNFDSYRASTLKTAIDNATWYEYSYNQIVTSMNSDGVLQLLTEDQVRAVQQAALWYFTNCDIAKFNKVSNDAGWLYVKENASSTAYQLASANASQDAQAQALYNYLVSTSIANAKAGKGIDNKVYLYTNTDSSQKANTQPIIMIQKVNKEFDLALRKYISAIYDSEGKAISLHEELGERKPNVDTADLDSGDSTTATYKHKKAPIQVNSGDTIVYKLVIYNEGEVDGRATKVIDQLPEGIVFKSVLSGNFESDGTYTRTNNRLTLVRKTSNTTDLSAYDADTMNVPAYEEIEISCMIIAQPNEDNDQVFTNIAWIAEHASNEGTFVDRDSNNNNATNHGSTTPNIPQELVTNDIGYINDEKNAGKELDNKDSYFEGQEDDDDFEKVILLAEKGSYDIVLVKEDADGEQLNDTATFEVDGVTKTVKGRLTIVSNKKINSTNVNEVDTYIIKETVPPDEYCAFDGTIKIEVYKKKVGNTYVVDTIKYYVDNVEVTSNRDDLNVYLNTDGNIYVEVKDYQFDLALRKFITAIKSGDTTTEITDREPSVTAIEKTKLGDEEATYDDGTTAAKTHKKDKLSVKVGDIVIYTIRVYNEGEVNGYASEVTDYLPEGLTFKEYTPGDGSINDVNGWHAEGQKITTSKLNNQLIKAFDKETNTLDYKDLQIECIVNEKANKNNLKNIAEITENKDENGKEVTDRDSTPNDVTTDTDSYNPEAPTGGKGEQDDDDFEDLKLVELDLALRKFITRVADNSEMTDAQEYRREPVVSQEDIEKLYKGEIKTANYKHTKEPVKVNVGDYVEYTLRVYNEGSMDGYAREITDHLPKYLKYVDCDANAAYNWQPSEDGRTIKTTYLKDTKLEAVSFIGLNPIGGGQPRIISYVLDSTKKLNELELKIICQVVDEVPAEENQTNIAEITKYGDKDNTPIDVDRDSQTTGDGLVKLPSDNELPDYKKTEIERGDEYIPGQQDDDDFEKIFVPKFDLALRKFITKVEDKDITTRIPQVKYEDGKISYEHTKEPVDVVNGNVVTYTLRIFNEGHVNGYASIITDDIPDGVVFLPENETNIEYRWKMYAELPAGVEVADESKVVELNINGENEVKKYVETTDPTKAVIVRTDYLSKEQGEARMKEGDTVNPNLLKAFDETAEISDTNPDYKDIKVAFKVIEPNGSERILINYAQISDDQDEEGKPVKDIDSTPDKWNEGEDDQDIEKIRVPIFDLALRKWVTQAIVTENGKTTVTNTGHDAWDDPEAIVKVDLNRRKLSNVTVKFRYSIRVYNQGEIEGYAKEITDYVPEGLKFVAEDNPGWTDEGNNVISTRLLENTLLKPGEFADVEVLLTWINSKDNMGLKVNTAEISEDYNEKGVPDKDSTPDNKKPGEDDIDDAPVMLSITTGIEVTYVVLGLTVLITIAGGIVLIKKFVM